MYISKAGNTKIEISNDISKPDNKVSSRGMGLPKQGSRSPLARLRLLHACAS